MNKLLILLSRFSLLILVSFSYLYLEWLFILSATSPLDVLPTFLERLFVTFPIAALISLSLIAVLLVYYLLKFMLLLVFKGWFSHYALSRLRLIVLQQFPSINFIAVLSSTIVSLLVILLVDNFTYSVLGTGISETRGLVKLGYVSAFFVTFYFVLAFFAGKQELQTPNRPVIAVASLLLSLVFASELRHAVRQSDFELMALPESVVETRRPNIILFGMDGVDSQKMSLYGYARKTTPFLDSLKADMLIFENGIANAVQTTGAITALLTGKAPATTKVLYTPHILTGADAYQHLPGILHKLGYTNIQETVGEYADSFDLNFRDAFDYVNGVRKNDNLEAVTSFLSFSDYENALLNRLMARLGSRIKHVLNITPKRNPFGEVSAQAGDENRHTDMDRVNSVLKYLSSGVEPPYLIHFHFLDTHGCNPNTFRKFRKVPEAGYDPEETRRNEAACDDSILGEDRAIEYAMAEFEKLGLTDDAIVVIYSDHTSMGTIDRRIPIALFDTDKVWGEMRKENVQLTDIAPTILDIIGVTKPVWMEGQSFLESPDPMREIYSLGHMSRGLGKPGYGMQYYILTVCQRQFTLNIELGIVRADDMLDHTRPCAEAELPTTYDAGKRILSHLTRAGIFDQ